MSFLPARGTSSFLLNCSQSLLLKHGVLRLQASLCRGMYPRASGFPQFFPTIIPQASLWMPFFNYCTRTWAWPSLSHDLRNNHVPCPVEIGRVMNPAWGTLGGWLYIHSWFFVCLFVFLLFNFFMFFSFFKKKKVFLACARRARHTRGWLGNVPRKLMEPWEQWAKWAGQSWFPHLTGMKMLFFCC